MSSVALPSFCQGATRRRGGGRRKRRSRHRIPGHGLRRRRGGASLLDGRRPEGPFPDPQRDAAACRRHVSAVDGVSLAIPAGRTLALVGESGCGKTTVGKAYCDLCPDGRRVVFDGEDLLSARGRSIAPAPARFSDHFSGPVFFAQSAHARCRDHRGRHGGARCRQECRTSAPDASRLSAEVGLSADMRRVIRTSFPGVSASGSQSRVRSPSSPRLVVCDEPTSALECRCRRRS